MLDTVDPGLPAELLQDHPIVSLDSLQRVANTIARPGITSFVRGGDLQIFFSLVLAPLFQSCDSTEIIDTRVGRSRFRALGKHPLGFANAACKECVDPTAV